FIIFLEAAYLLRERDRAKEIPREGIITKERAWPRLSSLRPPSTRALGVSVVQPAPPDFLRSLCARVDMAAAAGAAALMPHPAAAAAAHRQQQARTAAVRRQQRAAPRAAACRQQQQR
ncbi:unnamed protein product, partial [Laminaria digitata]